MTYVFLGVGKVYLTFVKTIKSQIAVWWFRQLTSCFISNLLDITMQSINSKLYCRSIFCSLLAGLSLMCTVSYQS